MSKWKTKIMVWCLLGFIVIQPNLAFANTVEDSPEALTQKLKRGMLFLLGVEKKLGTAENSSSDLKNNIKAVKKKITDSEEKIQGLEEQLQNITRQRNRAESKIKSLELQRALRENEIQVLEEEIEMRALELADRQEELKEYFEALYFQTNLFFKNDFKRPEVMNFLLADGSVSDILKQQDYLSFFEQAGMNLAQSIEQSTLAFEEQKQKLDEKKADLEVAQERLEAEKKNLEAAMFARTRLLEQTKGQQLIYERLLKESEREEQEIAGLIASLRENHEYFDKKLEELKNASGTSSLPFSLENYEQSLRQSIIFDERPLAWPVSPRLGISAFYHDEAYRKSLGVPHNAIDIRVTQGTPVRSAQDGVVYKSKDNGFGYSYVIIAHPDSILTLYGHLSDIFVDEGDIIRMGETIGLSGGMPGTKGAGWLTTGPHLHFEVFKKWKHVDPLEYLPLELVPVGSLPEKYLKMIEEGIAKKVRREEKVPRIMKGIKPE